MRRILFPFDSLAFTQQLEASGVPHAHATAISGSVLDVVAAAVDAQHRELASKEALAHDRIRMQSAIESCRNDLQTSMSTSQQSAAREIERLKGELERMRSDLKHEAEKISSSQKLDLNLEKGRNRDELQKQNDRVTSIDMRLDREVNAIRAQMEAGKNDMLRYTMGSVVAIGSLLLAAVRIML